jgi:hypothetical protein
MSPRKSAPMTADHKAALAIGRSQGLAVRRYLQALEENKPRRGRRPSVEATEKALAEIDQKLASADPLRRLHLIQERKDLQARLSNAGQSVDLSALEDAFVKGAAEYGSRKGISYESWREVGVPAEVLRRAGISRAAK